MHRATRKTITFKMVLAGLKSVNEKYPNSNLKSSHLRLLSIGDDDCASPPCDSPGRYGRYGYPGSYHDTDTTREEVEVSLPRRVRGESNCPTSTTELEPLSDHGAPPRVRRIAAAHVAPPRASRHFSARRKLLNVGFLNSTSHINVDSHSQTVTYPQSEV